jgi:hypothetical protein
MSNLVSEKGPFTISLGDSESRSGTPLLEMRNLTAGAIVKVNVNFFATTGSVDQNSGFSYKIASVNASEVTVISPSCGTTSASPGWQCCSLVAFFKINEVNDSPTEDVDFEVLFSKDNYDGKGEIKNFTFYGEVVSSLHPGF